MTEDRNHLTGAESGRYVVTTVSSSYLIDLDARTLVRSATALGNWIGVLDTAQCLDRIEECVIGKRARFHVRLEDDPITQPVTTTLVLDISPAGTDELAPARHDIPAPDGVTWSTVGGEGELITWEHLTLLGMTLIAGLAGNWLRLTRGDVAVDIEAPTAGGIPVTYSDGHRTRTIQAPYMVIALRIARRWLTATPPIARGHIV